MLSVSWPMLGAPRQTWPRGDAHLRSDAEGLDLAVGGLVDVLDPVAAGAEVRVLVGALGGVDGGARNAGGLHVLSIS